MLWTGPGNAFDTQEDLLSNVVGASVAFALHGIGERIRRARAATGAGHRGLARST